MTCVVCAGIAAVIAALVTWIIAGAVATSAFRDRMKK